MWSHTMNSFEKVYAYCVFILNVQYNSKHAKGVLGTGESLLVGESLNCILQLCHLL